MFVHVVLCCELHSHMEQKFSRQEFQAMADTYPYAMKHQRQDSVKVFACAVSTVLCALLVQAVTLRDAATNNQLSEKSFTTEY